MIEVEKELVCLRVSAKTAAVAKAVQWIALALALLVVVVASASDKAARGSDLFGWMLLSAAGSSVLSICGGLLRLMVDPVVHQASDVCD